MTALTDKVSRDSLGIDTIARGIAYASHLLKSVTNNVVDFSYTLSLEENIPKGVLGIRINLDYDAVQHFASGSDYLEGVLSLSEIDPVELFEPLDPAIGGVSIPPDNSRVNSLESYLAWLILLHIESNLLLTTPNVGAVRITQAITPQRFYKTFTLNLNYDPLVYAEKGNIIAAIDPGVSSPDGGTTLTNDSEVGNETVIEN